MSRNVIHYMSQSSSRLGTDLHPTVLCTPHPCLTSHISIYRNVSICTASLSTIGPKQPPPPQQAFLDPGLKVCFLSPFSRIQLFLTLWTIACQAPLSIGFPRHEYWSGLSCPPPGDLPGPGIEPVSALAVLFLASHLFALALSLSDYKKNTKSRLE